MTKRILTAVAFASSLAILSACGGGSDTAAVSPVDTTPPTTPADDSSMVSGIAAPSYAATSEEYAAYSLLNRERERCGFGTLKQSSELDSAARAHADWMILNNLHSHYESASYPNGFTGVYPADRASAAGYSTTYAVGEGIAFGSNGTKIGRGEAGVRELLAGVYHAIGVLQPMKDIGISVRAPADVGVSTVIVPTEIVTSTTDGYQMLPSDEVVTYPCEGTTGTEYQLTDEDPNPVPGRNLGTSPLGQPIIVMARLGQTLSLTAASMQRVSDGQSVVLRSPVTGAADPNGQLANAPQIGYILPESPLQPNTAYRVMISGTNNGGAFQKTFTTGN